MEVDSEQERRGGRIEGSAAPRLKLVTRAQDLLRELGAFYMPLRLMAASDVLAALTLAAKHQVCPESSSHPVQYKWCHQGHVSIYPGANETLSTYFGILTIYQAIRSVKQYLNEDYSVPASIDYRSVTLLKYASV